MQRASDEDRQQVVTRLREAAGNGILDLDELEDRVGAVYRAKTLPELARLTIDLPAPRAVESASTPPAKTSNPALANGGFRHHLTVYVLTIGMLIGIWVLSGLGHPWPFYPAAAWGIGLGSHFMAVNRAPSDRDRSRDRDRRHHERELRRGEGQGGHVPKAVSSGPSGQKRFVVAMFVDVVGSTGLNEALGDDGWVLVRNRVRSLLSDCFEREGGWEVSTAGDGVLARFEVPGRAVNAAIEINRRLARQREETGFAPSVRIGIHSGDVVEEGDDLIGGVVNLASRVTSAADPDQIMITEHVADHLESAFVTEDRGIHTLKGVSRPRHLLAVRWD